MPLVYSHRANSGKPHRASREYNIAGMSRDFPRKGEHYDSPVAYSLRAIINRVAGGSVNAWATKAPSINQSTINRIVTGQRDCTISMLLEIARKTGYAPWQLCHPDFEPLHTPRLLDPDVAKVAALFSRVKSKSDRRKVEAIIYQFVDPVDDDGGSQVPDTAGTRLAPPAAT